MDEERCGIVERVWRKMDRVKEEKGAERKRKREGNRFLVTSWELETATVAAAQPLVAIAAGILSNCQWQALQILHITISW